MSTASASETQWKTWVSEWMKKNKTKRSLWWFRRLDRSGKSPDSHASFTNQVESARQHLSTHFFRSIQCKLAQDPTRLLLFLFPSFLPASFPLSSHASLLMEKCWNIEMSQRGTNVASFHLCNSEDLKEYCKLTAFNRFLMVSHAEGSEQVSLFLMNWRANPPTAPLITEKFTFSLDTNSQYQKFFVNLQWSVSLTLVSPRFTPPPSVLPSLTAAAPLWPKSPSSNPLLLLLVFWITINPPNCPNLTGLLLSLVRHACCQNKNIRHRSIRGLSSRLTAPCSLSIIPKLSLHHVAYEFN